MSQQSQLSKRHLVMLRTAFGPVISKLLDEPDIIEVMLNPDGRLWFESLSKGKCFSGETLSPEKAENIIKLLAASRELIADRDHPELACELPESGARFQSWLPPVATEPTFTIRMPATQVFPLQHYLERGGITDEQMQQLQRAVKARQNILISGGTGSGKTTFANALLNELEDTEERIVVLEDLPELQIKAPDCVNLRTCNSKSMRDLVRGSLRMRPDRIIIGEVRDGSALELLKAWNTGHPGGICTIHANSADSTLDRLEDLILEAVQVVPKNLVRQAVNVIVFMGRNKQGQHCVSELKVVADKA